MEIEDNVRYDEIKDVFAVSVIFHGKNIYIYSFLNLRFVIEFMIVN